MDNKTIPAEELKLIEASAQAFVSAIRLPDLSPKALALYSHEEGAKSQYIRSAEREKVAMEALEKIMKRVGPLIPTDVHVDVYQAAADALKFLKS